MMHFGDSTRNIEAAEARKLQDIIFFIFALFFFFNVDRKLVKALMMRAPRMSEIMSELKVSFFLSYLTPPTFFHILLIRGAEFLKSESVQCE